MVGLGPEDSNFALELTYNYGIDHYRQGNDLLYFALAMPEAVPRAHALGYRVVYAAGVPTIIGPDNYHYRIVEPMAGVAERFVAVGLRSSDLAASRSYWCGVLGMQERSPAPGLESTGGEASLAVGWSNAQVQFALGRKPIRTCTQVASARCVLSCRTQVALHFVQSGDEVGQRVRVEHAENAGRIANVCRAVEPFYHAARASGQGGILNAPLTLPTPGKADVRVTILTDPDGVRGQNS